MLTQELELTSPASGKLINIGAIGAGMVMQIAHLPAIALCPSMRLVGIADLDEELARSVALQNDCAETFACHTKLLRQSEVDAVVVVTNRSFTPELVRDALNAGKHVLSEKPMAMTLSTARELADLAERKGLVYGVGFMKRYDAGVLRAKALLNELFTTARLGRLVQVCGRNFCAQYVGCCEDYIRSSLPRTEAPQPDLPEWIAPKLLRHYDWFANVGLHSLNLLRFLLVDPLSLRHAAVGYEHSVSLLLEARGAPVSLNLGQAATGRWEETLEFFFERGRLELSMTSLKQRDTCAAVTLDENTQGAQTRFQGHHALTAWCFTEQMRAFAEAVAGNRTALLAPALDSLRDMELLEEIFMKEQG